MLCHKQMAYKKKGCGFSDSIPRMSGKGWGKGVLCFASYRQWKPTGTRWDCASAATEVIFFSIFLFLKARGCFVSILSQRAAALSKPIWPSQNRACCIVAQWSMQILLGVLCDFPSRRLQEAAKQEELPGPPKDGRALTSEPQPMGLTA